MITDERTGAAVGADAASGADRTLADVGRSGRLRALRLVGFKSFAERTSLEFGPGISAIVGPNGSGKSNLADALRWALGEQGRSLRTRKSEDVIFAGSSTRQATGMADVALVIDNEDGLLPLDYTEVDLGRRLYRSGENEYLLNRQRIRLRDLVEVLDGANLADNAFLFIGQGMVDQALSLRPEERRPLFEEVAGIRRYERRRRQAESNLEEAEANLARVRDILAELRPQARRLAAQAEQQAARGDAAAELADALVTAGRARWVAAAREAETGAQTLASMQQDVERALDGLKAAEELATALGAELETQVERERAARAELDTLRARSTELRLAEGRAHAELGSHRRQMERLEGERVAAEERAAAARRTIALPLPQRDAELERSLARLEEELAAARQSVDASLERRDAEARADATRRDAREAEHRLQAQRARTAEVVAQHADAQRRWETAASALREASEQARQNAGTLDESRAALQAAESLRQAVISRSAKAAAEVATLQGRLARLEETLAADASPELVELVNRHGGTAILEGVDVDPDLRVVVEAALGQALHALTVSERTLNALRAERGTVVVAEDVAQPSDTHAADGRALVRAAENAGGGAVIAGVRRDPRGVVRRLVARAVWVTNLETSLRLRPLAPPGWRIVASSGEVVTGDGIVELGRPSGAIERRADRDHVRRSLQDAEESVTAARRAEEHAADALRQRADDVRTSEATAVESRAAVRRAEERERAASRDLERLERELAWEQAQLERFEAAAQRTKVELAEIEAIDAQVAGDGGDASAESRLAELERRRGRLADEVEQSRTGLRDAEDARRRAEVGLALDETRARDLDIELDRLREAEASLATAVVNLAAEVSAARELEKTAHESLAAIESAEGRERSRLAAVERDVSVARERLRSAEEAARAAEHHELEARFQLDAAREQLLMELAALGPVALRALRSDEGERDDMGARPPVPVMATADPGPATQAAQSASASPDSSPPGEAAPQEDRFTRDLENALTAAAAQWMAAPEPVAEEPTVPTASRVSTLRRRYQQLGASNPFAVEEYAEIRERVGGLERERDDLESAIESTRRVIAELTSLMADRFMTTFRSLESTFARQFEQLFGGGDARLELTDPEDLSATGIEILARPPGKKRQPLAMLSGGERALTAAALLFAMLEVHPVPFCVLDEVDAALDEANISRFVAALQRLAHGIQFIVITHNRGTIEAADALYGVTIGDDAVSRVISLRLAAPMPLPERQDREAAPAG